MALTKTDSYDTNMTIDSNLRDDLLWWKDHIMKSFNPILSGNYTLEIFTDASLVGWGAACEGNVTGGSWNDSERANHINYLELVAVFFGLKSFARLHTNCEILLRVDNTTAVSYVNKMGGVQYPHLNEITQNIWKWCEERNIHIFASYIKSSHNIEADGGSRNIDIEWELNSQAFHKIVNTFGKPDIDLFASRINAKCPRYVSWKPDPSAYNIDAFTVNWSNYFFYAFPPFALILKVLQKIINDGAIGIVVVPYWMTQAWFPLFKSLSVGEIIIFRPQKHLLFSNFRESHPLHSQLSLAASVLSAKPSLEDKYHLQQST